MILTRALLSQQAESGEGDRLIDLDAPGGRDALVESYRPPRADWVRLNLIATLSGSAAGPDGTSESITNPINRILLRAIRDLADVVVVGAASVRAEGYFVPKHAALAVVTRTGDLSAASIRGNREPGTLVVLCPASAVERATETTSGAAARIIAVPDEHGDLTATAIRTALREAGYASIVAEGGPTLAALLLRGGIVDELCLTTSPVVGGADLPLFGSAAFAPIPLELSQLLLDEAGTTYARWRVPRVG